MLLRSSLRSSWEVAGEHPHWAQGPLCSYSAWWSLPSRQDLQIAAAVNPQRQKHPRRAEGPWCLPLLGLPIAGLVVGQTQCTPFQHWEGDLLGPSAHLPKRWTGPGSTSTAPTFPNVGPADPMHTFAAAQRTPSQLPDGKLGSPSAHLPSIGEGTSQGPTHTFPNAGREARKCTPSKFLVLSGFSGR